MTLTDPLPLEASSIPRQCVSFHMQIPTVHLNPVHLRYVTDLYPVIWAFFDIFVLLIEFVMTTDFEISVSSNIAISFEQELIIYRNIQHCRGLLKANSCETASSFSNHYLTRVSNTLSGFLYLEILVTSRASILKLYARTIKYIFLQ